MLWLIFSICIVISVTGVTSDGCTGFRYEGPDGQESWGSQFNQCAGKHQSPIDIDSCFVKMVALDPLRMEGFNSTIGKASLTNNGHTAMMIIDGVNKPTITGGPLAAKYVFAQLHFHWGIDDSCGSENKFDDKTFPLELHIVFYKQEYGSVDASLNFVDGLTVLACIFELSDNPNPKYEPFVDVLAQVIEPGQIAVFPTAPTLSALLPRDLSQYFTYHGSLTTPPCSEAVTWIDFRETIKISSGQLAAFRKLIDGHGHQLINNFRAIQPLGDRIVRRNIGNKKDKTLTNKGVDVTTTKSIRTKIAQDVKNIPPPPPKKKI
ncbi:carbonic anhydrase 2-like [Bradysia coprophila]|uniref:carbonic anhydrase 2-like n=1 Tax=Bradysia coprophila TaxID=38358 RepID=UPI00187D7196|nr:carbonic anhydrase 2-like [Bradysia coprophila]